MGEVNEITHLISSRLDLTDESCMDIIDPPFEEKIREHLVATNKEHDRIAETNTNYKTCLATAMPWRTSGSVGVMLDNETQVVRANFFRLKPTSRLPKRIYNYRVGIFKIGRENELPEDLCDSRGEKALTTSILRTLISSRPTWHADSAGNPIGLAYNGTTTLYTTQRLDDSVQDKNMTYEVSYGGRSFSVILTETSGSSDVPELGAVCKLRLEKVDGSRRDRLRGIVRSWIFISVLNAASVASLTAHTLFLCV